MTIKKSTGKKTRKKTSTKKPSSASVSKVKRPAKAFRTYQQAMQSNQASGSNVSNIGDKSVAQVGYYALDLELVVKRDLDPNVSLDENWLAGNADQVILFGSDEYFEMAKDPSANQILQAGPNVIFEYDGKVVAVQEHASPKQGATAEQEIGFWEWLVSMLEWIFD